MIHRILKTVVEEDLNRYLLRGSAVNGLPQVQLGQLHTGDGGSAAEGRDAIIASLVNIQQERTNLNVPVSGHLKKNPPINLNLYLLFAADYNNYHTGLERLSAVIAYFQSKTVFTPQNTPGLPDTVDKVTVDMISLDFQELSNFWTAVGSKILPAVIYKLRMLSITADAIIAEEKDITSITLDTQRP